MKKVLLISLIAMMLIGMLMTACKPKVEETTVDSTMTEEVPVVDTAAVVDSAAAATTPAPAPVK